MATLILAESLTGGVVFL